MGLGVTARGSRSRVRVRVSAAFFRNTREVYLPLHHRWSTEMNLQCPERVIIRKLAAGERTVGGRRRALGELRELPETNF